MNSAAVEQIARAILYEGYLLYPYRTSSIKNRQRWTFGGLHPESWCAKGGGESSELLTECLVRGTPETKVEVQVRFLHLLERSLQDQQQTIESRQEAVEREVPVAEMSLAALASGRQQAFRFPACRTADAQEIVRQEAVDGVIEISAVPLTGTPSPQPPPPKGEGEPESPLAAVTVPRRAPTILRRGVGGEGALAPPSPLEGEGGEGGLFKLSVRVRNTALGEAVDRDEAMLRSLVSTHIVLGVRGGSFVSLMDPPEALRQAAADCRNLGVWPVLVGAEGDNDTTLASPIILYDYPQVAPESPGDLFDGTEIDEILTLRVLTLTDDEKQEVSAGDERGRALLARTEALAREQLLGLHGTMRGLRPIAPETPGT